MLRIKNRLIIYLLGAALLAPSFSVHAQTPYQKPPKAVLDVLDAPESAMVSVSPSRDKMLLSTPVRYPSIAELAEPMLRLAGSRINPKTNGPHNPKRIIKLTLKNIADGKEMALAVPLNANLGTPEWSNDGKQFAVTNTIHRPYSYLLSAGAFPRLAEVWDRSGKSVYKLADLPLADQVPIEGVPTGARNYNWRPTEPATLVWIEALDGGDTKKKVSPRDVVKMLKAPFSGQPVDLAKTEHRFAGMTWGEKDGLVFVRDFDRNRRWSRAFLLNADNPSQQARLIWDRSSQDRYNDSGSPVTKRLPNGQAVIHQNGDYIFLSGDGASPKGDRPFLDRFDLKTLKSERLFQCDDNSYESFVALLADDGSRFITRYETQTTPPNYFIRAAGSDGKQALTNFPDPTPQLRGIKKQLVRYKRKDGVDLSFTLYLPPDYKEGTPLPTVVWAYPIEFSDAGVAGQLSGSANRFTTFGGMSRLFFTLMGYAVLDDATMPVIGDPETMNNTYVEQIAASAEAAIDKAVEMGVTDRNRVGVGGHSYGAFMTANLLAHSDLFKAGIARSGAYNRTLTPFGFQSERRFPYYICHLSLSEMISSNDKCNMENGKSLPSRF